jgi:hypothetical protein
MARKKALELTMIYSAAVSNWLLLLLCTLFAMDVWK